MTASDDGPYPISPPWLQVECTPEKTRLRLGVKLARQKHVTVTVEVKEAWDRDELMADELFEEMFTEAKRRLLVQLDRRLRHIQNLIAAVENYDCPEPDSAE